MKQLLQAPLVATQKNPEIRSVYQRGWQAGKTKKLAWTACLSKLLTSRNAMVKSGTLWRGATHRPA